MSNRISCIIFFLLCSSHGIWAQSVVQLMSDSTYISCTQNCIPAYISKFDAKKTNTYNVSNIPYAPLSNTSGTLVNIADDKFSGSIPIGFDFCFFENTYNTCFIGANGIVTFNSLYANGNCSFDTKQSLPYFNASFPDNAIFSPFLDVNISQGGQIKYYTTGVAPWRKFVISYNNVSFFSTTCSGISNTFQIILYETSNIIESHITSKNTCSTDTSNWLNYSTLGIQNIGVTTAITAPGKNASIWTASNTAFRFSPAGANAYTIKWYNDAGLNIATNTDTISACPVSGVFPARFVVQYELSCPTHVYRDTLWINRIIPHIDSVSVVKTSCKNIPNGQLIVHPNLSNYTYSLDFLPYQTSNTFSNVSFGLHNVSVKDTNGCTYAIMANVGTLTTLAVILDSLHASACGDSTGAAFIIPSGGVAPYSYSWSTSLATPDSFIVNVPAGSYTVVVTDGVGCKESKNVLIQDSVAMQITWDHIKPICGNNTGKLVAHVKYGTKPYTYTWNYGTNTDSIASNIPAGFYQVTVTDSLGCVKVSNYQLSDSFQIFLSKDSIATTCGLNNGKATMNITQGSAPYTYQWSSGATTATAVGLAPGYAVCNITDQLGCHKTDSVYIHSSIAPTWILSYANSYCDTPNGSAIIQVQNMTAPIIYSWSNSQNTSQISALLPGNYVITVTDSNACVIKDTAIIGDDGSPHLQVVSYSPPNCYGDSTAYVSLTAYGGTDPYKYSTDGNVFVTTSQLYNMPGGSYYLYVRDANSCVKDTLINFPQPPELLGSVSSDTVICFGELGSLYVTAHGGTGKLWYQKNPDPFQRDSFYANLGAGTYNFTVKDSLGCTLDLNGNILGPSSPLSFTYSTVSVPCYMDYGGEIHANLQGGWGNYSYGWDSTINGLNNYNLAAGKYTIWYEDELACADTSSVQVGQLLCCDAYFPNAFTPNDNGKNDKFGVISPSNITTMKFRIYNRYGQVVYEAYNQNSKWDGTVNGRPADMGVYAYLLEYQCNSSKEKFYKSGEVHLIR